MSWPVKCAPPTPSQTPSTTSTPVKPSPSPTALREVNRSVRNTSTAIGSTINGVAAFQIPASIDSTRCSPYPKRVNGMATPRAAATKRWAHTRGSRGSRSRSSGSRTSRVSAPAATR